MTHEQEHYEFEAGRVSNEFDAAFQVSRSMTHIQNDTAKIEGFLRAGLFVAVIETIVYCRFTDAILGTSVRLKAVATSRQVALRLLGCEEWHDGGDGAYVLSLKERQVVAVR